MSDSTRQLLGRFRQHLGVVGGLVLLIVVGVVMAGRGGCGASGVAALLVSGMEAFGAGRADGVAAAFVFVVRGDVSDGFVESVLRGSGLDERHGSARLGRWEGSCR